MHPGKSLILVAAVLAGSQFGPAQQSAGADGRAIIQRASSAMGCSLVGPETTIAVTGTITVKSIGTVMNVSIQSQGNSRWRSELDTPKERKVTIVNSGKGQMQHADGGVTPLAVHNTSHQRPTHIPCLTNLALPPGLVEATYLRTETAGSDALDVIELTPKDRPKYKPLADRMKTMFWISRNSGYLVKMEHLNTAEHDFNDVETVEIDYSDYRAVNGLAVPFTQRTRSEGQLIFELTLSSVQLNTPAADFTLREANGSQK